MLFRSCADLGLTAGILDRDLVTLSGGQAARVSLAGILLSQHDVLLLDEPTNDLDFAGLEQLERFVLEFTGPLVVVSHDRAFLDRVVTHVAELDAHDHSITMFAGGWAAYQHERDLARNQAEQLATAAGVQLGDVLTISESSRDYGPVTAAPSAGMADEAVARTLTLESGSEELTVQVSVVFSIR